MYIWCWREIDFVNEKVRTLAGNGTKGSDYTGGGKGATQVNFRWWVTFAVVHNDDGNIFSLSSFFLCLYSDYMSHII